MKKLFLTITLLIFVIITLNGQSPWTGFFKKADIAVEKYQLERTEKLSVTPNITMPKLTLLMRPSLFLTALAIDLSEKQLKTVSSVGIGLSVGNFSEVNGEAYCNYSINAALLTDIKFEDTETLKNQFGAAITVDAYNKLVGVGVGYINKTVMPLITVSYSF